LNAYELNLGKSLILIIIIEIKKDVSFYGITFYLDNNIKGFYVVKFCLLKVSNLANNSKTGLIRLQDLKLCALALLRLKIQSSTPAHDKNV
jgi:hypothetical protein